MDLCNRDEAVGRMTTKEIVARTGMFVDEPLEEEYEDKEEYLEAWNGAVTGSIWVKPIVDGSRTLLEAAEELHAQALLLNELHERGWVLEAAGDAYLRVTAPADERVPDWEDMFPRRSV